MLRQESQAVVSRKFNSKSRDALPLVSVLFVTYKRLDLLERSFRAFCENTDYPDLELVIADDGSGPDIQRMIRRLPANVFALAPKNRGLGANNNNGLKHCSGKYVLMIQDDCICMGPRDYLKNTIQVMEANPTVGIVNYYGPPHPMDRGRILAGCNEPCYIMPKPYEDGKREHFLYTDQPHVVSRAALEHVGFYLEHYDMEESERDYNRRWRDQKCFATAAFPAYYNKLYLHEGAARSFRTTRIRWEIASILRPLKAYLPAPVVRIGKFAIMRTIHSLEKLRLVR